MTEDIETAALMIFLNKTGFNGAYQVTRDDKFNVSFGKKLTPTICDPVNLYAANALLQRVTILQGDYWQTMTYAGRHSFYYLDPPYRPLKGKSVKKHYTQQPFGDEQQRELKTFCTQLSGLGVSWLLSNSDPKNTNPQDEFFDKLYAAPDSHIRRIQANRSISGKISGRGKVSELLISNYTNKPTTE